MIGKNRNIDRYFDFVLIIMSLIIGGAFTTLYFDMYYDKECTIQSQEHFMSEGVNYRAVHPDKQPSDHLFFDEMLLYNSKLVINRTNLTYARVKATGSMRPTVSDDSIIIGLDDFTEEDLRVGDIISFTTPKGGRVLHRIVTTKTVNETLFYITKGDNVDRRDSYKTTFDDINYVAVGIIY
jgi:hypothetical protein